MYYILYTVRLHVSLVDANKTVPNLKRTAHAQVLVGA